MSVQKFQGPLYHADNLPAVFYRREARKKVTTTVYGPMSGPMTVQTREGEYDLPEGWRGYIAVDSGGYPYPIALDEFELSYDILD